MNPSVLVFDLLVQLKYFHFIIVYSRFTKNATIYGSIKEGEGDFGATFGLKQAILHDIV